MPHPWRVFVSAPRVGSHNTELPALNSAQTPVAPSLARFCLCAKGGKPQHSTARSQLSTNSGCPILGAFSSLRQGWEATTLNCPLSTQHKPGCPILGAFLSLRQGWEATTLNCPLSTQYKLRVPHPWRVFVSAPRVGSHNPQLPTLNSAQTLVPHPWRVFVFAPRVGSHNPQLPALNSAQTPGAPSLARFCLCAKGGKPQPSTAHSQLSTNSGAPSLARFCLCAKGGKPQPSTARSQFNTNSRCPILGAFLSLRQGWEATTLNCPLSTQHKLRVPHPWRVFVSAPRVGSHNPQLPALNSAQTPGAPSLARFCLCAKGGKPQPSTARSQLSTNSGAPSLARFRLCAKGGKPQPSTARSQLSTNSGAPSLARFCLCAKGGKPQPSTARSQLSTNSGCPILGASLRQGWEATTLNCPLSTQHKLSVPHPWRVFVSAPRVGSHNTQLPALNSVQTPGARDLDLETWKTTNSHGRSTRVLNRPAAIKSAPQSHAASLPPWIFLPRLPLHSSGTCQSARSFPR